MNLKSMKLKSKTLWVTLPAIAAGLLWIAASAPGQSRPATSTWQQKDTEWAWYTADVRGSRYRPLDQINASNFSKLEIAWRFKTDSFGSRPEYKLEGTPLMVGGVVYTTAGTRRSVVALDAKTGELQWVYSLHEGNRAAASFPAAACRTGATDMAMTASSSSPPATV
jgi:quinoprotein glucose dehydrogenase